MWLRLKRLFRAIFGGIISNMEDPEQILNQLMRDMQDEVPKMRTNVAQVMAGEKRLAAEVERTSTQIQQIDAKIKAAIRTGNDDIATTLIAQMQTAQRGLEMTKGQFAQAQAASQKARQFLDNYMLQFERRKAEAMQLLAANKQAQMQERLAQTMASFQVGDNSQTFDEMREKIANRVADAEAKAELATTSVEGRMASIDLEVGKLEATDMLQAYKEQMGLAAPKQQHALGEGGPGGGVQESNVVDIGRERQRQTA